MRETGTRERKLHKGSRFPMKDRSQGEGGTKRKNSV